MCTVTTCEHFLWLSLVLILSCINGATSQRYEVCRKEYSNSSGLFYSPSNLNVIKTSFKCVYVILKYNAYIVRLTFQTFLLGNRSSCETNYIEIRDGENEGSPLIGDRLCGNTPPPAITGTQSAMWILFATNGSSSNQGFTAYFTRLQAPVTCFQCQKYQKCVPKSGSSSQACVVPGAYFYDFGSSHGDLEFEEDGKCFKTVIVPDGFPFSSSTVKQVFIRVNGLVSLNNPNPKIQTGLVDIMPQVCSNWTDPQLNSSDVKFKVWYQTYLKTNITTSNQKSVFTKANSDVKMFMDRTFDATFVLVVTYAEIPPENGSVTRSELVNFQTVLITDGSASYSMIMYWTDEMQWNKALNGPFTINCIKETLNRNKHRPYTIIEKTELPVLWFESIDTLPARTNPELECKKWHDENMLYKKTIDFIIHHSKLLPTCPCNVPTLDKNWISENATQSGFQCFLNTPPFLQFGMRCCYTSRGSYEPNYPNSGSFLLNHPLKNYEEYKKEDVIPKKHCCEQSHLCCFYYDVRPNISCTTNSMHTTETVNPNTIGTSYQDKPCSALLAYTDKEPVCSPKRSECNHSLIIGFAVGVPLFSVFVVIIFLALYCNNKRPKFEVTNIFRRPSYGKPNERREEENRSNALGVPKRVTRAQLQSISSSIASVHSVNEVYAEIGDVPEYLEILNTPVHNQIQDTPLVKYNHGIPRDTVTQPAVHSKRFPAWNKSHAQPVPARKIIDTYLYHIPTVYERNGATDFKSDYLHPVYYPSSP